MICDLRIQDNDLNTSHTSQGALTSHGCAQKIVTTPAFETFWALMILVNTILVAVQTDLTARDPFRPLAELQLAQNDPCGQDWCKVTLLVTDKSHSGTPFSLYHHAGGHAVAGGV